MGLDQIVKTLILVKSDTSQAKAEIRSLRGAEKTAAMERLAELEKTNKGIEGQIARLAKIGAVIGGSVAAFKIAQVAAKNYLEDVRLQSAAAGANVEALSKATLGLVENDNLLAFAGKAQAGVWKLNQQEMETVLRGASALRKTMGVELQPTVEAFTEAVAKGNTRALKEFGIEATDKIGLLKEMDKAWKSVGGSAGLAGDEFERSQVSLADSIDDLSSAFGELVVALAPVISGLASAVGLINDAIAGWRMLFGGKSPWQSQLEAGIARANTDSDQQIASARGAALANEGVARLGMWARGNPGQAKALLDLMGSMGKGNRTKASKRGAGSRELLENFSQGDLDAELFGLTEGMTGNFDDINVDDLFSTFAKKQAAAKAEKGSTALELIVGTPAQINETAEAIKLATSAFEGFTNAAAAGFDAWITGSESFGAAFKKAIAEAMRALAGQMFVESLKHAAFAIGSLAFGDFRGAAQHGQAAAMFGAGALAAGVAAREMGQATGQWNKGSGGASAGAVGGAPARTIGNGSGNQSAAPITIYVGAEWASMSSIDQAASVTRMLRLGKRGSPSIRRH
jgi:hypothetical protein